MLVVEGGGMPDEHHRKAVGSACQANQVVIAIVDDPTIEVLDAWHDAGACTVLAARDAEQTLPAELAHLVAHRVLRSSGAAAPIGGGTCDPAEALAFEVDAQSLDMMHLDGAWEQALGYRQSWWLGQPAFWLTLLHDDDRLAVVAETRQCAAFKRARTIRLRLLDCRGRSVELWGDMRTVPSAGRPSVRFELSLRRGVVGEGASWSGPPEFRVRRSLDSGSLTGIVAVPRPSNPAPGPTAGQPRALDVDAAVLSFAAWVRRGLVPATAPLALPLPDADEEAVRAITSACARHGLDHHRVQVGIAEQLLGADRRRAERTLSALVKAGLSMAVTGLRNGDFACSLLWHWPWAALVLDAAPLFRPDASNTAALWSTLAIGQALAADVVADGVDTRAHALILQNSGCYMAQGDAIGPALGADAFVTQCLLPMPRITGATR